MGGTIVSAADASRADVSIEIPDTNSNFEEVYRRHGNWLVAFLRRRFSGQDAEDLAQETYVRTVGAMTEIHNPRAFLARVALRAARDVGDLKANRMTYVAVQEPDAPVIGGQEEQVLLKQLILKLPNDLRVVFLLSRFAGLSNEEVAQRCGISVKRVEARMTKARARLAALLRE